MTIALILMIILGVFLLGVVVITIPGLLLLPREGRNTVDGVTIDGEERDVCPGNRENTSGKVHFTVLVQVRPMSRFFAPIAHLASVITNVSRDWKTIGFRG